MKRLVAAMLGVFALSGLPAGGASAQETKAAPKVVIKTISENDKVRAYEATYAPGAENTAVATSVTRVIRVLKGGKLQRIHPDGKKEVIDWKPGMVEIIPPQPAYTTKNVGKSTVQFYIVQLK
jgi:mannose-6-phosphate isomerase-like protein (cupin superfamily)